METENTENILARRKEIESEIVDMLKETESDFSLQHVKDAIFHEEDNDDMMKVWLCLIVAEMRRNWKMCLSS